jgi:phospholipase/carboxylesterase
MRNTRLIVLVVSLLGAASSPAQDGSGKAAPAPVDWSKPETIDVFDPAVGGFLDVDLWDYRDKAKAAHEAGDSAEEARWWLLVVRSNVTDFRAIYELARCYGRLGKAELAAAYLERAYKAGDEGIGRAWTDGSFATVRGTEMFRAAMERIRHAADERADTLGAVVHVAGSAYLECRLLLPKNYDPAKAYPAVIALHGFTSRPEDVLEPCTAFEQRDFYLVVPRAPYPLSVRGSIGYSWRVVGAERRELEAASWAMSEQDAIGVLAWLKGEHKVSRAYLLGISQGAALALTTGIRFHDQLEGVIAFGSWLDRTEVSDEALDAAKGLRVFLAHGTEDDVIPISTGMAARDRLKAAGYDVTFHEFKGGHVLDGGALEAAEKWMREHGQAAEGG